MAEIFKKPEVLDFKMNDRLGSMLTGDKALQFAQELTDYLRDRVADDDSPLGEAFRHYENFHSSTNPSLFDDLIDMSKDDARDLVLKLLLRK